MLTSVEKAGIRIYIFLSYINPFQIWFFVLLMIGIKIFTDSGWAKSFTICIIYWLIVTLFPSKSSPLRPFPFKREKCLIIFGKK